MVPAVPSTDGYVVVTVKVVVRAVVVDVVSFVMVVVVDVAVVVHDVVGLLLSMTAPALKRNFFLTLKF